MAMSRTTLSASPPRRHAAMHHATLPQFINLSPAAAAVAPSASKSPSSASSPHPSALCPILRG
ncbi:hypothetical protein EJ04DRAFT_508195 [Polyplosphaeria fusca]|uniref:Uncharacterized protein n=1 Tax=Polyplosphaeria fusca TaxID=682080 RepID=A0A9P4V6V1_9PLEO|nr:hypothetical protein EJ04DRAFT_508195 [Polyplosphaeria fusca]